jgi:hypothetical protein
LRGLAGCVTSSLVEPAAITEIHRVLRALRRRMTLTAFVSHAARATLFFFGLLVLLRAVAWWFAASRPDLSSLPYMLSWPVILGAIAGLVLALLRRPSLPQVAATLDALGGTRDRLLSSLRFDESAAPSEFQRLAIEETRDWIRTRALLPLVPLRIPGELKWLAVPLATLALLWWHELGRAAAQDAAVAQAQAEVGDTVRSLDALAQQVAEHARAADDETLRKIAERLKQSATQVRAEASQGGEAQKTALRELSELEQLVKQLRQPDAATPDELKALAQALAQREETKEAAKSLEENRLEDAARELDRAREQPNAQQAEATLQRALEHLAQRKEQLSKQLEQVRQQTAAADPERKELLQQLSEMLRQMEQQKTAQGKAAEKSSAKPGAGKSMSNEDLQKLLGALQQLKDRQQNGEPGTGNAPGEEPGKEAGPVTMFSFGQPSPRDPGTGGDVPTGQPGSENDQGTTKDPFAATAGAETEARRLEQLKGDLGEGESLSALIPMAAGGGDTKAARRYKELTEAAAAAAEDAVLQENIPLGARFLIQRYFEAIRAKQ